LPMRVEKMIRFSALPFVAAAVFVSVGADRSLGDDLASRLSIVLFGVVFAAIVLIVWGLLQFKAALALDEVGLEVGSLTAARRYAWRALGALQKRGNSVRVAFVVPRAAFSAKPNAIWIPANLGVDADSLIQAIGAGVVQWGGVQTGPLFEELPDVRSKSFWAMI